MGGPSTDQRPGNPHPQEQVGLAANCQVAYVKMLGECGDLD